MVTEPLREVTGTSDEALMFLCEETPGEDSLPNENTGETTNEWDSLVTPPTPELEERQRAGHLACHSRSCRPKPSP